VLVQDRCILGPTQFQEDGHVRFVSICFVVSVLGLGRCGNFTRPSKLIDEFALKQVGAHYLWGASGELPGAGRLTMEFLIAEGSQEPTHMVAGLPTRKRTPDESGKKKFAVIDTAYTCGGRYGSLIRTRC